MFVAGDDDGIGFAPRNGDRNDFRREPAIGLGGGGFFLAPNGEAILVLAADGEFGGQVFRRFRHGFDAATFLHPFVDKAPADGGVVNFRRSREGFRGLCHDEGSARHALHAAGDEQLRLARDDGAGGGGHGFHARSAQAVDGAAGNGFRQAGQERGHAGDVAIVFARLVGAAENHIVQRGPIHRRVALHQGLDAGGGQIIGPDGGESFPVAADGRADGVADKGVFHDGCVVGRSTAASSASIALILRKPDCMTSVKRSISVWPIGVESVPEQVLIKMIPSSSA